MRSLHIGIDPGASGGIASILTTSDGKDAVQAYHMPDTEQGVWALIRAFHHATVFYPRCRFHALIEQVQGHIGGGANREGNQPGSAMFKFGMSYGSLRMALIAAGIPFEKVPPASWQSALDIPPRGGKSKSAHKNVLKVKAQELFPDIKVTLATSDALLLAYLCRIQKSS